MDEDEYTRFTVLLNLAERIAENKQKAGSPPRAMVIIRTLGGEWLVDLREGTSDHPLPTVGSATLEEALKAFVIAPPR